MLSVSSSCLVKVAVNNINELEGRRTIQDESENWVLIVARRVFHHADRCGTRGKT
jgi:hypothetical protein